MSMAFNGQEQDLSDVSTPIGQKNSKDSVVITAAGASGSTESLNINTIKRQAPKEIKSSGLFQSKSWFVAPPPPPVSAIPVQQVAPVMPFTYIGKMIDGDEVVLFLYKGDRQYTVKLNDVIEDNYRVDKISDNGIVLTYLPMSTQQILSISSPGGNLNQGQNVASNPSAIQLVPQIQSQDY